MKQKDGTGVPVTLWPKRLDHYTLTLNAEFGQELEASFVSAWKANEFDRLDDDIHDVADRQILKELGSGALVIRTVGDYCEHMVRCYQTKPQDVIHVLFKRG